MSYLADGFKLMIVGMGMVYAFLGIMIVWVMISAKLSAKFAHLLPEPEKPKPRRPAKSAKATSGSAPASADQSPLAAVVSAAVQAYRRDHK